MSKTPCSVPFQKETMRGRSCNRSSHNTSIRVKSRVLPHVYAKRWSADDALGWERRETTSQPTPRKLLVRHRILMIAVQVEHFWRPAVAPVDALPVHHTGVACTPAQQKWIRYADLSPRGSPGRRSGRAVLMRWVPGTRCPASSPSARDAPSHCSRSDASGRPNTHREPGPTDHPTVDRNSLGRPPGTARRRKPPSRSPMRTPGCSCIATTTVHANGPRSTPSS